jgi:predicted ATP-dependent endonuclease of OLD family
MNLERLHLTSVGGISELELAFDPHLNVLCGPNGIGKTTILESIAHCFAMQQMSILKRNVASQSGFISAHVRDGQTALEVNIDLIEFLPGKNDHISGLHALSSKLLSLKVNRTFNYKALDSVTRDQDKPPHTVWEEAKTGVRIEDVKNWFVNRYLYSAHINALSSAQLHNLEVAKKGFSVLQDGFSFSRVLASSNEIMVNTPSGEIYYEYLSSGFKSCLSVFIGIIKEVEYRFGADELKADDFDGIVLIDEIELHLHPEWQAKISGLLKQCFQKLSLLFPHIVLT